MTWSPGRRALHAGTAFQHLAAALVAQHAGKRPLRIIAGEREGIGVADAADATTLSKHLALARAFHVDFFDANGCFGSQATAARAFIACLLYEMPW